jgi:high affinity Mn2+ porin
MEKQGLAARALFPLFMLLSPAARAEEGADSLWSLHGQATFVEQYHPAFRSPYRGPNSLDPGSRGNETLDLTLFAGVRLWDGVEAYANPEIDQGFGLSNTLGVAGYPSGEAYKVGRASPYFRLQRLFLRQTFDLGSEKEAMPDGPNMLGGHHAGDNVTVTAGKISVTDIFDTNSYAHDPKGDFLNWSLIDAGAFDYAADAWGYSYGVAGEWKQDWWTARLGLFNLSRAPNATELERNFSQFELVAEFEARHTLLGREGAIKLLGFLNRGRFGSYDDALRLGSLGGTAPDTARVRRYSSRPGASLNLEQQVTDDVGAFARFSFNDGSKEADEFTEINRSVSFGLSVKGGGWGRPDDVLGLGSAVNVLSGSARNYFAAGGLGILIGDGQLPHYGTEDVMESYYSYAVIRGWTASLDYQLALNPAYNRDRGPVSFLAARLHSQF